MSNTFYSSSSNSNSRHENHVQSDRNGCKIDESNDEISTYTISLRKRENGGLGFLIRQRDEMPYFSIWEIIKNGSADQNGRMKIGDIILRVNNEDIRGYSYERGLELLKSFKPGALVELTLQSCDPNELNQLNNYFKQQKQMESSKINGVMSPLQKLKRKFITCASHNADFTNHVNKGLNNHNTSYDDQNSIYLKSSNDDQFKKLNGKYSNSDLEDSGGGIAESNNQMKNNKSNATISSSFSQNQASKPINNNNDKTETIQNETNSNLFKGNENNFFNNKSTVNNKLNADNNSNFDSINSSFNISNNNLNSLLKNLSLKEKNQLLEELKKSLEKNNMNSNYNYDNNNEHNNIDPSIKSPLNNRKKFYYDNIPNNNSYQYTPPITYSGTTLRKFNTNNQPSLIATSPKLTRQNSNDFNNTINHISHSVSSGLAEAKYNNQNENSYKKFSPHYISSSNSIDKNSNNKSNDSNNNLINRLNNSINIPITAVAAATTTTTTTTTTAKLNRNIQFNTTDIYEPVESKGEPATIKSVKMSTTTTAALASLPTAFSGSNDVIAKSSNNDKIRSQTLTSLNKIGQENDMISNNKHNMNNEFKGLNKSTSLRCPIDGGFSQALAIKHSDTLSLEENISDQQKQNSLSNISSPKTMPKTNTIQIIQDGDDIRISIDGNIEILTNRSTDKRIISLSPQCSRKLAINQSNEQLNDHGSIENNDNNNNNNATFIRAIQDCESGDEKKSIRMSESFDKNNNNNQGEHKLVKNTKSNQSKLEIDEEINSDKKQIQVNTNATTNNTNNNRFRQKLESVEELKLNEATAALETKENMNFKTQNNIKSSETVINSSQNSIRKSSTSNISQAREKIIENKRESISNIKENVIQHKNEKVNESNNEEKDKQNGNVVSPVHSTDGSTNKSQKKKKGVKLKYLVDESTTLDVLHHKAETKVACTSERCMGSILFANKIAQQKRSTEEIMAQAADFINQFYASVKREGSKTHKERLDEVIASIKKTGTYDLKETELCFGARTAWRNAPRCIGRIQWSKLQVFDARYVTTARGMFEAVCNHIKYATNKGNIRSAITIFRQRNDPKNDFRVWNSQFVSYAGYKVDEDTVIGDRANLEFTEICLKLGWKPKYTDFDILPLVLQANGQDPEIFELPSELAMELDILHPKFDWFADLKLKWYCVPGVSSMMLDVGGIEFTACPFNGWYMVTEIGRDLADINRYNKLPIIAQKMGLDTKSNSSLWRDKALIELNYAVISSFQKANTTIVDHHTASESFMKHYENENQLRGGCPGDWVWVVPPLSSHLTPVFHLEMLNYALKPSYEYQDPAWKTHVWKQKNTTSEEKSKRARRKVYFSDIARAVKFSAKLMGKALAKRVKCTILYATETGKSERFAKSLAEIFKHAFDAKTLCMKDYDVVDLEHETLLLIVTSTFGNGDPPENGEDFRKIINDMRKDQGFLQKTEESNQSENYDNIYQNSGALTNVRFAVFGLGNSSYPKFCSFGKYLDNSLKDLGADRIHELGLGDELCGQEDSFRTWSIGVYKSAVEAFCIDIDNSFIDSISKDDSGWSLQTVRLTLVENKNKIDICEGLSTLHSRKIYPCKLVRKRNLQKPNSGRITLSVELNTQPYSSELEYYPGDHIGILASNRQELIEAILTKVTNAPPADQLIKVEILKEKTTVFGVSKQWVVDERYPQFTLKDAFKHYLDITSPLTQKMLMYFSSQTSNENERIQLEKLSKDPVAYEEWKLNKYPNLAEVLEEFPCLRPNASLLITQLPKLQPRFYSVSSSPKVSDDITITAGVVEYTPPKGKHIHYGVCTKWLDEINIGEIVPAYIRGALSFRLPTDKTCPIIMVGAGTGIAPFRSFWQERKIDMEMMQVPSGVNGTGWGKMYLYFGCRLPKIDELYSNELDQLIKEKVITSLYLAFSREPNKKKVYVQDLIEKNMAEVCDVIYNKQGHFYICGDVRMAAEVTNRLELALTKQKNMTLGQAKNYINEMKENLRFHEDIFGNSVNTVEKR